MTALQVKDCPDTVYDALRRRAASENRSIAQQALTLLEEGLGLRERHPDGSFPRENNIRLSPWSQMPARSEHEARGMRGAIFERLDALPRVALPNNYATTADLVADCRDER